MRTDAGEFELPVSNVTDIKSNVKIGQCVGETILSVEAVAELEPRKDYIKHEEIIVDEAVSKGQKDELVRVLNKYRDCIAKNPSQLGCTNLIEMDMEIERDK